MIEIDGVVILATVEQIIEDLRADLHLNGINLLKDINYKEGKKDIQVTCPVHKNGQEHKPSCGVSTVEVIRNGTKYHAGTVHCFTCGYTADLFEFVSYCWGSNDRNFGKRYVIQKYNTMNIESRPDIKLNLDRTNKTKLPYSYIEESELDRYRYTSTYLYNRGFNDDTIYFYEFGYDKEARAITIPVRDHKGGLVFIKKRMLSSFAPNKYLNVTGVPKQHLIYGFYHMLQLIDAINNKTCLNKKLEENYKRFGLIITEGEFNTAYLVQNGYPAISLLGRILFKQQKELLLKYGIKQLSLWLDNDDAGKEAHDVITNQLRGQFKLTRPDYEKYPDLNDANEFTPEQLDTLNFITII